MSQTSRLNILNSLIAAQEKVHADQKNDADAFRAKADHLDNAAWLTEKQIAVLKQELRTLGGDTEQWNDASSESQDSGYPSP